MLPRPIIDELSIILGRRALRYETERPRDSGLSVRTRKEALVIIIIYLYALVSSA